MQKIIKPLNNLKISLIYLSIALLLAGCVTGQLGKNNSGEYKNGMVVSAHP
jgi:gamma-glutamyltranspeptidase/glutathione hydrolase